MNVNIVKPRPEHVSGIARVCDVGWRQTVESILSDKYQNQNAAFWYNHDKVLSDIDNGIYPHVALIDGEVVGAIGGAKTGPERGDVFVLYVDETYRYQGVGRRLLAALTEEQIADGAFEQWVSVEKGNWRGIPFYEARGFELQREQKKETDTGEKHVTLAFRRVVKDMI
ncbi:GNAT family N-acetyltransferase [Natribacillus halophilus]|uniref:Ribosomal protein S18 acetylase RimI n=1 Tax=Natribacillus halophilus TaxID=549003 RepID=A0A1G8NI33_9BACI|nr:GNAT family N-acetyltransferase [Natribacillus halophilus]SDI79951.1 Ribosomal protein S18 acetylase RimI [Natribacillus halophilus]